MTTFLHNLSTTRPKRSRLTLATMVLLPAFLVPVISTTSIAAETCENRTFQRVLKTGKLVVGVKDDYKPWGFRIDEDTIVGMEIDMAQEVADVLGVALETVPVKSSNRIEMLEQGNIDLMIATMADRADRRKIVGIVLPNYYSSGTNIMSPKSLGITAWSDLDGQLVCGKEGAFYNKIVQENYGAQIVASNSNAESKQALKDRECVAWVYDDSSIRSDLASGEWDDYEMPLRSEDGNPWALAVSLAEKDCAFGQLLSGIQYNWLRTGRLMELEEKWGIQTTDFLKNQQDRFADWLVD